MKKRDYALLADIMEKVHILEVFVYLASVAFLFHSPLRMYGAWYLFFVFVAETSFDGQCPLFLLEERFKRKAGEKIKVNRFLPEIFKKYFNINLSGKVGDIFVYVMTFISVLVILRHYQII